MKRLAAFDFDGTVNRLDVGSRLAKLLVPEEWGNIKKAYEQGDLTNYRVYTEILIPRMRDNGIDVESAVQPYLSAARGFTDFVRWCRSNGYSPVIVSDGFDIYIESFLRKYDVRIEYFANSMKKTRTGYEILFPNHSAICEPCGTCKADVLKKFRTDYQELLYVGDGESDICPSREADAFFGKRRILNKIRLTGSSMTPSFYFRDFAELGGTLAMRGEYKAVIFDLDGTIVDGFDIIYESFNYALKTLGLNQVPLYRIRKVIGPALSEGFRMLVPGHLVEEGVRLYREYYRERYLERNRLFHGVPGFLRFLKDSGVIAGLITNKKGSFARDLLEHLKIADLFDFMIGADEGMMPKPHSNVMDDVVRRYGIDPKQVIYVGDSVIDGEFSRNAGTEFIAAGMGLGKERELYKYRPLAFCADAEELFRCLSYLVHR